MKKRLICSVLVALLILSYLPVSALATPNESFQLMGETITGTIQGATVDSVREVVNTTEYTKADYKNVICYEIKLSSVSDNDTFAISLTPFMSMPSENFGNFPKITTIGYTYSDMITNNTSSGEIIGGDPVVIPGGDVPVVDIPGGDVPVVDIPGGDVPVVDIPGGDVPVVDIPGGDVPVVDIPGGDVPVVDIPGGDPVVIGGNPKYCISDELIAQICANDAEHNGVFNVTLNNGKAQLIVFYYDFSGSAMGQATPTWIWEGNSSRTPYAVILNFIVDGVAGNDVALVGATPSAGQFDREFELYSGSKEAFLIVPRGSDGVDVVFELSTADASLSVNGNAPVAVSDDKTISVHLSSSDLLEQNSKLADASKNKISLYHNGEIVNEYFIYVINQRFSDLPDKVVDYLCIGSQYTNVDDMFGDYGLRAARSLVGSNITTGNGYSGPVSLGNLGGYITYYYEEAITDNPANPYGIDFITFGNSVNGTGNFGEPGQVWVSEDGVEWYALAGGMHYDDTTLWDYSITYTKADDGTTIVSDSLGKTTSVAYSYPDFARYPLHRFNDADATSITLSGINVGIQAGTNEYGNTLPKYEGFGYTDRGSIGTVLEGESSRGWDEETLFENLARNVARNPYLSEYLNEQAETYSVPPDGMDLAWAVDADGQPVSFPNGIHYIKIVTASNIYNDAIGEKSTEVNMVRVAQAASAPVGKTAAPTKITVDGVTVALEDGKFVYDNVPVDGPFKVVVDAPEDSNIYINNNCAAEASFDGIPTHQIVRVIVQEGEKEPAIYILNLKETTSAHEAAATLTLNANGGTVNGKATDTIKFDVNMVGDSLPTPENSDSTLTFGGWYAGQIRYTAIPANIADITLVAQWIAAEATTTDPDIHVTFRLIGSTLATEDINLADGDYHGAEYVTWISTTSYTMAADSTVADLIVKACQAAGITQSNAAGGYVSSVTAPASLGGYELKEFTNGKRSGWMYTINGAHPDRGVTGKALSDGDTVILHYVDDYAWEVADWGTLGGSGWPQLSDSTNNYWNKWLTAADTAPGGSSGNNGSGDTTGGSTSSGDKKDETKPDETTAETTTAESTVTADDGSTVKTETEKVVDTTTNADGSVTETVTETTKTTVTTPDNVTTVTETVVETETTTDTVKNDDGSVTDKTETVEKVTETVTGEDGKKTTTVTETAVSSEVTTDSVKNADGSVTNTVSTTDTVKETVTAADGSKAVSETTESKSIETTVGADGKTIGTGTVSATTTVKDESGKTLSTAVTEGTVTVSTDDKGTVSEVTTATTKTTDAVTGEVTEETTVTTEAEMANGTTGKTVENEKGETLSAEANVSEAALQAAQNGDGVIELPITVNTESGATVQLNFPDLPDGTQIWAEIGTTETSSGDVAYLKLADGVVKLLPNTKTGSVIVPVNGSCEVIVKDNSKSFTDVDTSAWYGDSVKFVTAREIFNGNGDGTFAPGATMNRAMAAQIIFNFDGATAAGSSTFSDVDADAWYAKAVAWAAAQGIVNGYNGAYSPLGDITRQDLVKILYFYAQYAGYDVEGVGSDIDLLTYADGADVSDYAAAPMRWAIASGLIQGYADNTLRPRNTATRAEVAALMQRMVMNVVK